MLPKPKIRRKDEDPLKKDSIKYDDLLLINL